MLNVVLATNNRNLLSLFDKDDLLAKYKLLGNVIDKDEILPMIRRCIDSGEHIDCLVAVEGLQCNSGRTTQTILSEVHYLFPNIRIIFIAGYVDLKDTYRVAALSQMVKDGIYDIYHEKRMSKTILEELIDEPKTFNDVEYLVQKEDNSLQTNEGYKNVVMISSIKPGSGKSFLATNMAVAIAKYGKNTIDGRRPRVAIIEGDLQTLSIGTLLQIDDPKANIREALRAVSKVVNNNGYIVGTEEEIEQAEKDIQRCFVKHYDINNLYVLAGSVMSLNDINIINSYQYYYLIQSVVNYFDVIIVDTNSSLEHKSTGALLELADHCYYLLDLDSNNIRNNIRYKRELDELKVSNKIHYVLNRNLTAEIQQKCLESLNYSAKDVEAAGFNLTEKIPMIDISIAYNHIYRGMPIVLDESENVKEVRKSLIKIANTTWPIDGNLVNIQEDVPKVNEVKKKKKPWWKFW